MLPSLAFYGSHSCQVRPQCPGLLPVTTFQQPQVWGLAPWAAATPSPCWPPLLLDIFGHRLVCSLWADVMDRVASLTLSPYIQSWAHVLACVSDLRFASSQETDNGNGMSFVILLCCPVLSYPIASWLKLCSLISPLIVLRKPVAAAGPATWEETVGSL